MAYNTPFTPKDGELYIRKNIYKGDNERQPDFRARGTFDGQPVTIALWKREGKSYDYFCKIEHYTPTASGDSTAAGILAGAAELEAHRRQMPAPAPTANTAEFSPSDTDLPF